MCAMLLQSCLTLCDPWTVARQAPLSMGFSRQEYWSGLPCLPPGDVPGPGVNPCLLGLLHWQAGSLLLVPSGKPFCSFILWLLEPNKKVPLFCDISIAGHYLCSARPDLNSGFADPSLEGVWIFSS